MKILFITSESFIDHSFTIIRELKKHVDLETIFIAKKTSPESDVFCNTLNAMFYKRLRFLNPVNIYYDFRLLKLIKKKKADLVWFNTLSFAQVLLIKFFLKRFLVSVHDIETHPENNDYHFVVSKKMTLKLFKKNIAVMSRSQAELFEKFYSLKPYLLQLPIIDYYETSAENITVTAEKNSKVRFLFFGNIKPYKGIDLLLKAAEILNAKNLDFELNIFGKIGYNTEKITASMNIIKNINYTAGHIDYKEVQSIYLNNDVIIIPYRQVTQSGPLLIAYNRNMPCITSDLPGFREYVTEGKSGLIFNNTAESLAEKMEELINNPKKIENMGMNISKDVKNRFSIRGLANDYIKVFGKLVR